MKPTALLINTARGGIIDEAALGDAFARGASAVPRSTPSRRSRWPRIRRLRKHDACLVTPHMAWYSEESAEELNRKVAEEAIRFAKGGTVRYPVNDPAARPAS